MSKSIGLELPRSRPPLEIFPLPHTANHRMMCVTSWTLIRAPCRKRKFKEAHDLSQPVSEPALEPSPWLFLPHLLAVMPCFLLRALWVPHARQERSRVRGTMGLGEDGPCSSKLLPLMGAFRSVLGILSTTESPPQKLSDGERTQCGHWTFVGSVTHTHTLKSHQANVSGIWEWLSKQCQLRFSQAVDCFHLKAGVGLESRLTYCRFISPGPF